MITNPKKWVKLYIALCGLCLTLLVLLAFLSAGNTFEEFSYFLFCLTFERAVNLFPRFGFVVFSFVFVLRCLLFGLAVLLVPVSIHYIESSETYKRDKAKFFKWFVPLLFGVLFIAVIGVAEVYLYKKGYSPGGGFDAFCPVDTVRDMNCIFSDSNGINRHYPNIKIDQPINNDGFVAMFNFDSVSLSKAKKGKKKTIMVIGDSFTLGVASNYDSTYMRLLDSIDAQNLYINFGITGTDPLNYRLIAERYVSLIKPDIVLIAFCYNDFMVYDRKPSPGIPLFYAGNFNRQGVSYSSQLPACFGGKPNNNFPNIDSVYRFYYKRLYIPGIPESNWFDRLCGLTRVTSKVWWHFHKVNLIDFNGSGFEQQHLHRIKDICDLNKIDFAIAFIPSRENLLTSVEEYKKYYNPAFRNISQSINYYGGFKNEDYLQGSDSHWNDKGNRKFALFVVSVVRKRME